MREIKRVTKNCEMCGKTMFDVTAWRKYCEICAKKEARIQTRKRNAKLLGLPDPEIVDNFNTTKNSVNSILKKAKANHMTYGEYVARMERSTGE